MDHEPCPRCGAALDIVIDENGVRRSNSCTNPDCVAQQNEVEDRNRNNSYT